MLLYIHIYIYIYKSIFQNILYVLTWPCDSQHAPLSSNSILALSMGKPLSFLTIWDHSKRCFELQAKARNKLVKKHLPSAATGRTLSCAGQNFGTPLLVSPGNNLIVPRAAARTSDAQAKCCPLPTAMWGRVSSHVEKTWAGQDRQKTSYRKNRLKLRSADDMRHLMRLQASPLWPRIWTRRFNSQTLGQICPNRVAVCCEFLQGS